LEKNGVRKKPVNDSNNNTKQDLADALRDLRNRARSESTSEPALPPYEEPKSPSNRLESLPPVETTRGSGTSPERVLLNETWDVSASLGTPPKGGLGRLFSPLRRPLQRLIKFALGPLIDRQAEWNSAQVKFDNDVVAYIDARVDRLVAHYDDVLGSHGKRMEEIDERHLILQQELIQHVHDIIKRIDFVFETAEQNHLYLEGSLREVREELQSLGNRLAHKPSLTDDAEGT
jgi:hypothetical protein